MKKRIISLAMSIVMCISLLCIPSYAVEMVEDQAIQEAENILEKEGFFLLSEAEYKKETSHSISGDIVITRDYVDKKSELFLIKDGTVATYVYADLENRILTRTDYIGGSVQVNTQEIRESVDQNERMTRGIRDYESLGRVRYRYANGSQYSLCGANVALASTVSNSGQYDLAGQYDDEVALAYAIVGFIGIPLGFAYPVAAAIITGVATLTGYVYSIKEPYYISAKTTTNNWKVTDTSSSSNYDVIEGVKYVITEQGRVGETYYDGDFWEKTAFTGRNESFANYIYPLLFNYVIFEIYDWSIT
ncbi:hypothetical protein [uncultured Dysosmobacter sp.]|uniref:hypothetical protein n=1 Tax=uncultured Dysosmobacter sp. TaxID=2591384 RepID=UPI0026038E8F|nr:hypothetical protein [uncultured Dysosmobacter sp.]